MTCASQIRTPAAAARCTVCGQTGYARHLDGDGAKALDSRGEQRVLMKAGETNTAVAGTKSVTPTCPAEPEAINRFKSP